MKAALLERLPSIGTYTGPWTHGTIRREPVKDNDLLAEAGDRIDNAVFDFICAVVTGHSVNGEAPKEALLAAVNELSVEHVNALPEGLLSDATNEAKEAAGEHSLQEDADDRASASLGYGRHWSCGRLSGNRAFRTVPHQYLPPLAG